MTFARQHGWRLRFNVKKAGWSFDCVSRFDCDGRRIWVADADRGEGKRFVVQADEKLTGVIVTAVGDLVSLTAHASLSVVL